MKLGAIEQHWLAKLSIFDYTTSSKSGKDNGCADYLSRFPIGGKEGELDEEDGDIAIHGVTSSTIPAPLGERTALLLETSLSLFTKTTLD